MANHVQSLTDMCTDYIVQFQNSGSYMIKIFVSNYCAWHKIIVCMEQEGRVCLETVVSQSKG